MKKLCALGLMAVSLTACGSTERTVVEKPVIIQPQAAPIVTVPENSADSVELNCPNGYSKRTHSCY